MHGVAAAGLAQQRGRQPGRQFAAGLTVVLIAQGSEGFLLKNLPLPFGFAIGRQPFSLAA